jgi:RHS repeat-associated protein
MTFGTTSLRHDLAHRLTKATIGTTAHTFTYDPLGNRSKDTGPTTATTTTYAWDPNGALPMLASAKLGSTQKDFFFGNGLQAMRQGSTIYYYDQDQTGSVSNIVKANGTLEYSYSYQPYGQFRSNNKNDTAIATNFNPMGFDSEYADLGTTGFVDLRAREYDPATGTFLTPDPIGKSPDYTFADGNPAMYSDHSGLCGPLCVFGIAVLIGAALGGTAYGVDVALTDRGWSWGDAAEWAGVGGYAGAICVAASLVCYGAAAGVGAALGIGAAEGGAASAAANGTSAAGTRVIGHFPEYETLAQQTGAKYFSVPPNVWNSMSSAEQWAANQRFLDRGIASGDIFRLATRLSDMRIPSSYADEISYLLKNGYSLSANGDTLIPGG